MALYVGFSDYLTACFGYNNSWILVAATAKSRPYRWEAEKLFFLINYIPKEEKKNIIDLLNF